MKVKVIGKSIERNELNEEEIKYNFLIKDENLLIESSGRMLFTPNGENKLFADDGMPLVGDDAELLEKAVEEYEGIKAKKEPVEPFTFKMGIKLDGMEEINKQLDELQTKAEKINATLERTKELTNKKCKDEECLVGLQYTCGEGHLENENEWIKTSENPLGDPWIETFDFCPSCGKEINWNAMKLKRNLEKQLKQMEGWNNDMESKHIAKVILRNDTIMSVECDGYKFEDGFIHLCKAISDDGRKDVAVALIQQSEVKCIYFTSKDSEEQTIGVGIRQELNKEDVIDLLKRFNGYLQNTQLRGIII